MNRGSFYLQAGICIEAPGRWHLKIATLLTALALLTIAAFSQTQAPPNQTDPSPAKSIGMFAYPKNSQGADQQLTDEQQCYASAKQDSGIDPKAPPPATQAAGQQQPASAPKGGAVKGSAKGAAGGAAIGAITGDAGTGAAVGATAGAMAGRRQQKKAEKAAQQQNAQAQQQAQAQATSQQQASLDTFKRAFSACMDARGYSVK